MTGKQSLVDFAKAEGIKSGGKCWLCSIPERAEVEEAILSGHVTRAAATRWLKAIYPDVGVTTNRVENHMLQHVRPA